MSLNGANLVGVPESEYRDPAELTVEDFWHREYQEDLFTGTRSQADWKRFVAKWWAFHEADPHRLDRFTSSEIADLRRKLRMHYQGGVQFTDSLTRQIRMPQVLASVMAVWQFGVDDHGKRFCVRPWSSAFKACCEKGYIKMERDGQKGRLYIDEVAVGPTPTQTLAPASDKGAMHLRRWIKAVQEASAVRHGI